MYGAPLLKKWVLYYWLSLISKLNHHLHFSSTPLLWVWHQPQLCLTGSPSCTSLWFLKKYEIKKRHYIWKLVPYFHTYFSLSHLTQATSSQEAREQGLPPSSPKHHSLPEACSSTVCSTTHVQWVQWHTS